MTKRLDYIDIAKGIGIILVVIGHSPCFVDDRIKTIIYSFHMPLFFVITGYLFNFEKYKDTAIIFVDNKLRRIIKPYFIYCVISYIFWGVINGFFPYKNIAGMIYGNGFPGWMDFNIPLWFLPCMFCACVIFFITTKAVHKLTDYKQALIFISIGIAGYEIGKYYKLPWGTDVSLVAQVFMFAGYKCKNIEIQKSIIKYILIAFLIILQTLIITQNGKVDMNARLYGNLFLFYTGGIVGSFAILNMSACFLNLKYINIFMSYIGRNSLQIFALHSLSFELLFIITPYLPQKLITNYYFSLNYYIFGAILVSVFFSKLFENKIPPVFSINHPREA